MYCCEHVVYETVCDCRQRQCCPSCTEQASCQRPLCCGPCSAVAVTSAIPPTPPAGTSPPAGGCQDEPRIQGGAVLLHCKQISSILGSTTLSNKRGNFDKIAEYKSDKKVYSIGYIVSAQKMYGLDHRSSVAVLVTWSVVVLRDGRCREMLHVFAWPQSWAWQDCRAAVTLHFMGLLCHNA